MTKANIYLDITKFLIDISFSIDCIKENKYFANIFNTSTVKPNEVVYGQSISGVRGFYSNVIMSITNSVVDKKSELFSVSSNYVESSY